MSTIRWSPISSIYNNAGNSTMVVGSSGSGKSFFLINTAANCIGMGQRVVVLDPKNDFSKLLNVSKDVIYIDVNNIRDGALNPFTFLEEHDVTTISSLLAMLCGKELKEEIADITPIIQDFIIQSKQTESYADLQALANYLLGRDNSSAQRIAVELSKYANSKYGKLLFTKNEHIEPLEIPETASFIISLHGMKLPSYDKDEANYTDEERFCSSVVYLISKKLNEVLTHSSLPTTLFLDEAHILFRNPVMAGVIDDFMRLGRSLKVAVVMASQGLDGFPKGISKNIISKFIFRNSTEEAEEFLRLFDVNKYSKTKSIDGPSVITSIANLKTGSCFFIDREANSGFVKIQSIYPVELLTSNPFAKKEVINE